MTTEPEMEAYRHILTSILFSKKYGPIMAEAFGNANESKDLLLRKGLDNTIIDLRNNEIGRTYDYLINNKDGENFTYTIENIKGKGKRYKKMKSENYYLNNKKSK